MKPVRSFDKPLKYFWEKVNKTQTCWEWTAFRNQCGYGVYHLWDSELKKDWTVLAHRYIWEYENGEIPNDICVCHRCDNPACVRLDHLFLGTHQENMDDMRSKNRWNPVIGSNHGMAKLTENDVREIRRKYKPKVITGKMLSEEYGVAYNTIRDILDHRRWGHVV